MLFNAKKLLKKMLDAHVPGEKLPTECGVYAIVNRVNGRAYIGSSLNIRKRAIHHRCHLRAGRHSNELLRSDWLEYGEDAFVFGVLRLCHKWDRTIIELDLTAQILGPSCYSWSESGQKSRYLGHPAVPCSA